MNASTHCTAMLLLQRTQTNGNFSMHTHFSIDIFKLLVLNCVKAAKTVVAQCFAGVCYSPYPRPFTRPPFFRHPPRPLFCSGFPNDPKRARQPLVPNAARPSAPSHPPRPQPEVNCPGRTPPPLRLIALIVHTEYTRTVVPIATTGFALNVRLYSAESLEPNCPVHHLPRASKL